MGYKNGQYGKILELDTKNIKYLYDEKEKWKRISYIAAYYKYLIEVEKQDIIGALRVLMSNWNSKNKIKLRDYYFIDRYYDKINELPYSDKVKNSIFNVVNYIINFEFTDGVPYIPMSIVIYAEDREYVKQIVKIIGNVEWYFHYADQNMKYYDESMNNG